MSEGAKTALRVQAAERALQVLPQAHLASALRAKQWVQLTDKLLAERRGTTTPAALLATKPAARDLPQTSSDALASLCQWADECQIPAHVLPRDHAALAALTVLDFGGLTDSERAAITYLPPAIGELRQLISLNLWSCIQLRALPDTLGQLSALSKLDLSFCIHLSVLPPSLGQLQGLQSLQLRSCNNLTALPESIGQLQRLKSLNLGSCWSLRALPASFEQLLGLESLNLTACWSLKVLPQRFKQLTQLKIKADHAFTYR
ncbi:MAG: leucine-rich repeat domain-containing protein [Aeromonas sp.]